MMILINTAEIDDDTYYSNLDDNETNTNSVEGVENCCNGSGICSSILQQTKVVRLSTPGGQNDETWM